MMQPKVGAILYIFQLAKEGDKEAIRYLQDVYHLKVYTFEEIDRINTFIREGLSIERAIKQAKEVV